MGEVGEARGSIVAGHEPVGVEEGGEELEDEDAGDTEKLVVLGGPVDLSRKWVIPRC